MKLSHKLGLVLLAASTFFMSGCDKTEPYEIAVANSEIHFNGAMSRSALVEDPAAPVVIEIGSTNVSNADRLVTYTISSPTATAGVQYTGSASGTVTIPAGQALASITIQPIASAYPLDARDTLLIALVEPSMKPSSFGDTLTLILRGQSSASCSEDAPVMNSWLGDFNSTFEVFNGGTPYGPYTTSVTTVSQPVGTSATFGVANLWDTGWGPITFTLDWSNPSAPTTAVVAGDVPGSDAGDLSATYAGQLVAVRPLAATPTGTYSFCNQTAVLNMQLGVSGVGYFAGLYSVTIGR